MIVGKYHLQDLDGKGFTEVEVYDGEARFKLIGNKRIILTSDEVDHYQSLFDSQNKKKESIQVLRHWMTDEKGVLKYIVSHNGKPVAELIDDREYLLSDKEIEHYQEILNTPHHTFRLLTDTKKG